MWFDVYGVLASLKAQHGRHPPAISATSATRTLLPARKLARVAEAAGVAAPLASRPANLISLALDACEERAAIREFDGGQPRPEAEQAALHETAVAYNIAPEVLTRHIREQETGR